jgi:hypothetical protein
LISNFGLVLNIVCFLLGYSPASEFYKLTFRNTVFYIFTQPPAYEDGTAQCSETSAYKIQPPENNPEEGYNNIFKMSIKMNITAGITAGTKTGID